MEEKFCKICKETKPRALFSKDSWSPDGLQYRCKTCRSEYHKKHRDHDNIRNKQWYDENREAHNTSMREHYGSNKDYYFERSSRKRASKKQATPAWLTKEQIAEMKAVYAEAIRLTKETGVAHEVDHIVPLTGKTARGLHVPWNLQILTAQENRAKWNYLLED